MKSLRTIAVLALMLPFASPASTFEAPAAEPAVLTAVAGTATGVETTAGFKCCWVWMFGQWYCIPC